MPELQDGSPTGPPPHESKPPLWQSKQQNVSVRGIILSCIGLVFLLTIMSSSWLERHVLVTPPAVMDLQIVRVEGTSPGDETQLTTFRYIVALPDGAEGRFVSERTYRVGTRLTATVWRSRLSSRAFVAGPYKVLAE